MPVEYSLSCSKCGYFKKLNYGSFFSPFDSCGKMWAYRIYVCNSCGNTESFYLPKSAKHRSFCKHCHSIMQLLLHPKDLNLKTCPQCHNTILKTNVQLKQSNKLLDDMATSMANTVKWGVTSSIFNTITQSISKAYMSKGSKTIKS